MEEKFAESNKFEPNDVNINVQTIVDNNNQGEQNYGYNNNQNEGEYGNEYNTAENK